MAEPQIPPRGTTVVSEERTFRGAAVVQLSTGDPELPGASAERICPATVVLSSDRILALSGNGEWCWLLEDLEAVRHSVEHPWSIFVVPEVPDHGVEVRPADAEEFRRRLSQLAGGTPPPAAAPTEARAASEVVIDLDGDLSLASPPPHAAPATPEPAAPATPEPAAPTPAAPTHAASAAPPHAAPAGSSGEQRSPAPLAPDPAAASGPAGLARLRARPAAPARSVETGPLTGIEARSVSAWFGTHHVLDRVSLEMPAGMVTALIGPSGCGKSTFVRILNRMHEMVPSASLAGEVLLGGVDIYGADRKLTDARRQIGMVFQKPNPFPAMSIYDNVVASFRLTGTRISDRERDDVAESCLRKAGLWAEVRDRLRQPGGSLSGGQQQRLCIARALAIRPKVLLMDEPCSALDPTSTRRIEETIAELRAEVTIVIVTHNMQQAARVSQRCAFFLAEHGTPGVIVEHGDTETMFSAPQDPRTSDYVHGRFG